MLEGESALVNQEAEAVVGFATEFAGTGKERGFGWGVDRVVGAVMREKEIVRDDGGVGAFESE